MKFFEKLGSLFLRKIIVLGEVTIFTWKTHVFILKRPFSVKDLLDQMVKIGFNSIPVACVTALSIGMVMALQTGFTLEAKLQGTSQFLGAIVGLSFVRELGPVLTSLMVTGRIGSAIAAEIGTMKVTEQIDALITLSANPVQYLAVPRFLASITMFPILAMMANILGLIGGGIIAVLRFDQNFRGYVEQFEMYVAIGDVVGGLAKSAIFGGLMAIISCDQGFRTFGGAEGVGKSTTNAVVLSFMAIIISDYLLNAIIINLIGI